MTKYLEILLQDKEECGDYGAADIMFAIDSSVQMGLDDYLKSIEFVKSLVRDLQIEKDKLRVGAFSFSSSIE